MQTVKPSRIIRFEPFEVDLRSGELRKHGTKVRLQEQPFQVLAMLLEQPGELVTREEMRKRLWAEDTFVDFDHGLNAAINRLRERLRDDADNPRYIETIPRRGYRFIGKLEVESGSVATARTEQLPSLSGQADPWWHRKQWLGGAVMLAALLVTIGILYVRWRWQQAPPRITSLAVLPLENLSGDSAQEYFSDGMTDELITQLAKISFLRVISRTSVMRYKGTRRPLPEVARELNVDAIVEGSVVRSGDRVRVSAQLIHAVSDRHLWAESYERDVRDITTLQSEVARDIAFSVRARMEPGLHVRLNARRTSPAAYEAYLRGRHHLMNRRTPEAMLSSIESFQESVRLDPAFALAYVGLADSLISGSYLGVLPARDAMSRAKTAALKALEMDPDLGEAHASLGVIYFTSDWDWNAAEKELLMAVQQAPNHALGHHFYANYLSAVGRHQEALAAIERAHELDPFSFWITRDVGRLNYFAGHYEPALAALHAAAALDPSSSASAYNWVSWVYEKLGRRDQAVEADLKYLENSGWPKGSLESALSAYRTNGWEAYWRKRLQLLTAQPDLLQGATKSPPPLAVVYSRLGENDVAFALMRRACEERSIWLSWVRVDPTYDRLRQDPRFADLLHCVGADRIQLPAVQQVRNTNRLPY